MRIAFITYELPPDTGKGGIGTYTTQMANALALLNWDVHVFAGSNHRSGSEVVNNYHVHRIQCGPGNDFRNKIVACFETQHHTLAFDIIESAEINGDAREIKKKYPHLSLVVRLHAPGYLVESLKKKYVSFFAKLRYVLGSVRRFKFDLGYWRPYNKWTDEDYRFIQVADYITAPSAAMKDWVVKNWQIPASEITVIPNIFSAPEAFVNIPVMGECTYRRVIFFGRLNVLKGLVNATKAMKKILKEYPGWHFRVIGDNGPGPSNGMDMRKWMQQQLHEVIERVEFLDGVAYEDLPGYIKEGEIVLLPSLFESFSYTCAEAMAAGKAVVGSNNGGMADLLKNGEGGILIDPDNDGKIYIALKKLIDNDAYRYQLSLNARRRIGNDFNAKETAIKFCAFYENIVEKQFAKN